jgi:hypothetical protein
VSIRYGLVSPDVQSMIDSMADCRGSPYPESASCDSAIREVFVWTTPTGERVPVTSACNADDPTDRQYGNPCVEAFTHGDKTFFVYYPLLNNLEVVNSLFGCS